MRMVVEKLALMAARFVDGRLRFASVEDTRVGFGACEKL